MDSKSKSPVRDYATFAGSKQVSGTKENPMMIKPAQSMLKTKKGKLSRPVSKSGRQNNIPKVIKMKEEASAYGSLRELSSNLSGIYNKNQRIMDDSLQISTEDGGSQFRK
jgi:hypothetical protein